MTHAKVGSQGDSMGSDADDLVPPGPSPQPPRRGPGPATGQPLWTLTPHPQREVEQDLLQA